MRSRFFDILRDKLKISPSGWKPLHKTWSFADALEETRRLRENHRAYDWVAARARLEGDILTRYGKKPASQREIGPDEIKESHECMEKMDVVFKWSPHDGGP